MITTVDGLRFGQLVCSNSGRDRQQFYLIMGFEGDRFIEVVNGSTRSVAKGKLKNIKHVQVHMLVANEIEAMILTGEAVLDSQVRAAIMRLKKNT